MSSWTLTLKRWAIVNMVSPACTVSALEALGAMLWLPTLFEAGHAEHVAGKISAGLVICGLAAIRALRLTPKRWAIKNGVARLDGVRHLKPGGQLAGARHSGSQGTQARRRKISGIGDLRVGGDQGVDVDPKPLGDCKHGVPRLDGVRHLKPGGQLAGIRHSGSQGTQSTSRGRSPPDW